jgi:hypothetical protein
MGGKMKILVTILMVAWMLTACGGGGGNVTPVALTVSGTASEGALILGKIVKLKDANGVPAVDTITNATTGSYSIDVTRLTAPFLVTVTGNNGTYVTLAETAGTANINPITTTVVALSAGTSDMATLFTGLTPAQLAAIKTSYIAKSSMVTTSMQSVLPTGVTAANYFTGTITAGSGMDSVFDIYQITITPSAGITVNTKGAGAATVLTIPAATVTANTSQALPTITNLFTTAMLSGKTFAYTIIVGNPGTITLNADYSGTSTKTGSGTSNGIWSINSSGQLIFNNQSQGVINTITIVSGNATQGWTCSIQDSIGTNSTMTLVPTTPVSGFTTAMLSGKSFTDSNDGSILTFSSNGTFLKSSSSTPMTWSINSSGQIVVVVGNSTGTATLLSGSLSSGLNYYMVNPDGTTSTGTLSTITVIDSATNLMWQLYDSVNKMDWYSAVSYCSGLTYGGYTGWRLPSRDELKGLDASTIYNQIQGTHYAVVNGIYIGSYWSSTIFDNAQAYHVFLTTDKFTGYADKSGYTNLVRCVRQ